MIFRWIIGGLLGTLLVWIFSPWFVRSYAARVLDPMRGIEVLPEGLDYRWRAEGYATTRVGQHGMMGRPSLPSRRRGVLENRRIALWGDSQAEGVCVRDDEKLFSQLEMFLGGHEVVDVLPFAQSGQDARDWLEQFPRVEKHFGITEHLVLLTEWNDVTISVDQAKMSNSSSLAPSSSALGTVSALAKRCPDFAIHAARGLFLDSDNRWRQLRFGVGPVGPTESTSDSASHSKVSNRIVQTIERLRSATKAPITIAYAPQIPVVSGDRILKDDPGSELVDIAKQVCKELSITLIDCRPALLNAPSKMPHGFHNGQWGNGHLNSVGLKGLSESIAAQMHPAHE